MTSLFKFKKRTTLCLLFLVIFFLFFVWQSIYLPKAFSEKEDKLFLVQKGQNLFEIAGNLEKEGLIKSDLAFIFYAFIKGKQGSLQAGGYLLNPAMNVPHIAGKIILGDIVKEKITIIEGWNLRDIGWYLEGKGMFQAEELFELVGFPAIDHSVATDLPQPRDFSSDFGFLKDKPQNVNLEGYLFPDTYHIKKGASIEEIVRKMLDNFAQKLTSDLKEEIKRQEKSIFEIITMASLLEKEVKTKEDREIVAGILWKRLKNNIPLQVDATITYIAGKKTTKISTEDTQIDSPYNTYKYPGFPLGPICNPGLDSIMAALFPQESIYWFYLSTPEGETIFSKNYEEHNLAKAKYLK